MLFLLGNRFENRMMFLKMEGLTSNSGVYSETALSVSTWAGRNPLLGIGVTSVFSEPLISSHFCGLCKTEEEKFFFFFFYNEPSLCDLRCD